MRVTIYDRNPGKGFNQWFLKTCWAVGCWFQKLFGAVDAYVGVESWGEAKAWLGSHKDKLTSIQFWGHGGPGAVYLSGKQITARMWIEVKEVVAEGSSSLLWFRTCSTFQGQKGFDYSKLISDGLGITVAGHTRIIGPLQGGLHTRKPGEDPSWPVTEAEFPKSWWPAHLRWGNNTIIALATKIPKGW